MRCREPFVFLEQQPKKKIIFEVKKKKKSFHLLMFFGMNYEVKWNLYTFESSCPRQILLGKVTTAKGLY